MDRIEVELLQCPDCAGDVHGTLRCTNCGRRFVYGSGVYDLLPKQLDVVKRNEDLVFADGSDEVKKTQARPWRRIIARHEVLRFDYEIVDMFHEGRFLELGGEMCFASAIFKSVFPRSIVYASDVSPNALRNAAIPTCSFFPRQPDFFVALDAENIPFKEGTFDSIFALTMIHHLPNPVKMLNEVHRVLKHGGRFIAIDHSIPGHFRWLFANTAHKRAHQYGIQEDLMPYSKWVSIITESALPLESLQIYTNPKYQYNPLYILAGQLVNKTPSSLARHIFPVGIMIVYDKP
jgi:ubiquinone/menaquinone biosynthesis C-methylase UbiE